MTDNIHEFTPKPRNAEQLFRLYADIRARHPEKVFVDWDQCLYHLEGCENFDQPDVSLGKVNVMDAKMMGVAACDVCRPDRPGEVVEMRC